MARPLLKIPLTFTSATLLAGVAYVPDILCGQYVEFTLYVEFDETAAAGKVQLETAFAVEPVRSYAGTWAAIGNTIDWADDTTQGYASVTGVFDMLRVRITQAVTSGTVSAYIIAAALGD